MSRIRSAAESVFRRARNTLGGGLLDQRIVFLHFEKCAGTSLCRAIHERYVGLTPVSAAAVVRMDNKASFAAARAQDVPVWEYRLALLRYFLARDPVRYVYGHFQVDRRALDDFAGRFAFVTMLREPVSRWLSHYTYNRHKSGDHGRIEETLEAYLGSPRGRALGCDYVTLLTGNGDWHEQEPSRPSPSAEDLQEARSALSRFALVGRVDAMAGFVDRFRDRFGASLRVGRENVGPVPRAQVDVSYSARREIAEVCAPNLELYEHARRLEARGVGPEAR